MLYNPFEDFTALLSEATTKINELYMRLPRDGNSAVHRERVYCYELYHQLRVAWKVSPLASCPLVLNGEVDKSGQSQFEREGLRRIKPDFLIHGPGNMDLNHTAIEVKSASYQKIGLLKDLATLHYLSTMEKGYKRQILLVFGHVNLCRLLPEIEAFRNNSGFNSPLELWCHSQAGRAATLKSSWNLSMPEKTSENLSHEAYSI